MNYSQLTELCQSKNVLIQDLCNFIGMTRPGLTKAMNNQTIELRKLKLLCDFLRISPALFFEVGTFGNVLKPESSSNENADELKKEIEYLKQSIKDKDQIISLLREKDSGYNVAADTKREYELSKKRK